MTELSSVGAIGTSAAAGVGMAVVPGVDVWAIVGGFAGSLFFVTFAADQSFKSSLGHMLSSWIFGYFMAVQSTKMEWPIISPLVALASAAVFVILFTGLLEWLKGGKPPFWFRYIPGLRSTKDA